MMDKAVAGNDVRWKLLSPVNNKKSAFSVHITNDQEDD